MSLKAGLNYRDMNGHTCLHIVSFVGDYKQVRYFLKKGADSSLEDN